jgi:hypothetical protein
MRVVTGIMDRITELLSQDGFRQPSRGIYVRNLDETWRAWLAVDPGSHLLIPTVGIFSEELLNIRTRALKKLGIRWTKRKDGPPLIKINLHQLLDDDAERFRASWSYTAKELQPSVADDVVYCFQKKGYPYIERQTNYAAVFDAIMEGGRGTPALPVYLPMILIKLNRLDLLSRLTVAQRTTAVCEDMSINYEMYVNALLELEGTTE